MTSWEKGRENVDEVLCGVDGGGGNGVERLAALVQQNSTGDACGEAGRKVFPGIRHCASELDGAPIPTIALGGEDCLACAGEQFQRFEIKTEFELPGESAVVSNTHAALDTGKVCGFDHEVCERQVSRGPFEVGAEFL